MADLDQATLDAAEQVVLDLRNAPGRWANEARLLSRAADAIRALGTTSTETTPTKGN